jgi:hypothetical protein
MRPNRFTGSYNEVNSPDTMKSKRSYYWGVALALLLFGLASCTTSKDQEYAPLPIPKTADPIHVQAPAWSSDDLEFFLHGSMSTESAPETMLRAFIRTYPDLFPKEDLSHFGLIPDTTFGWPVGFSRSQPKHLGGLPSVGLNRAACHVGEIQAAPGGPPVRVLA